MAGLLAFVPALAVAVWIIRYNINAGLRSLQFSNLSAFWSSILSLYRRHSDFAIFEALTVLIIVIYFVMLWQWISVFLGLRTLVSERRVWALSSAYFVTMTIIFVSLSCIACQRANENNVLGRALMWTVLICLIPASFISITVPLWLSTPKSLDALAEFNTRSH